MDKTSKTIPRKDCYKCQYCSKSFSSKSEGRNHRETHTDTRDYRCTLCTYSCTKKTVLTNHIRTHTQEKPFKCPHPNCSFASSHACYIKTHQLVHTKDDGILHKFQCRAEGCSYKTSRNNDFTRHLGTHSDSKPFACDLCPYRAKTKVMVTQHCGIVHSSEKRYKCPMSNCNFACKYSGNLGQHMKTHSDEKGFPCNFPDCTYKARLKSHLTRHLRIHTGEKPYKCNFCSYSSTQRSVLVVHIRGHTGEAPYPCQICCFRGKVSGELARHVKVQH